MLLFLPDGGLEVRHSREGSGGSGRSSSSKSGGQHCRQNSKDKMSSSQHSRQNSRELLTQLPTNGMSLTTDKPSKNIEIYATLPKKKVGGTYRGNKARTSSDSGHIVEDEEYVLYDRPGRERSLYSGRTLLGKKKDDERNAREKRARSEERNKNTRDYTVAPISASSTLPKDGKKEKGKVEEISKKANGNSAGEAKQGKKQHKIRRKLLMGGLIRRKNRSMPDLREGQESGEGVGRTELGMEAKSTGVGVKASQDDSSVGIKGADKSAGSGTLSGYLSEGHLEYTGGGNPNLERSRLMRKSFHGSAGKILHVPKVPPPPPLRTTSQLSAKPDTSLRDHSGNERPQFPLPSESNFHPAYSHFHRPVQITEGNRTSHNPSSSPYYSFEPQSLPYLPTYSSDMNHVQAINECLYQQKVQGDAVMYANGGILCDNQSQFLHSNQLVTQAEVHNEHNSSVTLYTCEQNSIEMQQESADNVPSCSPPTLPLPPYPSPLNSVSHSRQVSEDFPPPPPPLDTAVATEAVNKLIEFGTEESLFLNRSSPSPQQQQTSPSSLLVQLQQKRQQILAKEVLASTAKETETEGTSSGKSGEEWLKELQAKQAERKLKKLQSGVADAVNKSGQQDSRFSNGTNHDKKPSSVKDLASRFENIRLHKNQMPLGSAESEVRLAKTITSCASKFPVTNGASGRMSPFHCQEQSTSILQPSVHLNSSFNLPTNFMTNCPPNLRENRSDSVFDTGILSVKKRNSASSSSVECLLPLGGSAVLQKETHDLPLVATGMEMKREASSPGTMEAKETRKKNGKKKNVTFCDQVILVATAEDEEKDSYIPNPILERVLRSAFNGKQESPQQPTESHIEVRNLQDSELHSESARSTLNVKENSYQSQQQKVEHSHQPYQKVPLLPTHNTSQYSAAYQHVPQQTQHTQHQNVHQTSQQHDPSSPYKPIHPDVLRTSPQVRHFSPPTVHPPYQHVPVPQQMYHSYTLQQSLSSHQHRNNPLQQHVAANLYPEQQQANNLSAAPLPVYNDISQIPPEYQHPPQPVHQPYYHHQQQFSNSVSGVNNGHTIPYQRRQLVMNASYQQSAGHGTDTLSYLQQPQQLAPPYQHPPVRQIPASAKGVQNQISNKDAGRCLEKKLPPMIDNACHLCRKKQVVPPAVYCGDCDFYLSRFRPRN